MGGGLSLPFAAFPLYTLAFLLRPSRSSPSPLEGEGRGEGGLKKVEAAINPPLPQGEGRGEGGSNSRPFHANKACTYTGGMLPFAKTKAERLANNDPRPSLEERYGDHAGYVAAVKKAAANAVAKKFLLQKDADALVAAAEGSGVLRKLIEYMQ